MKKATKYLIGSLFMGVATLSLSSCSLDEYNPSGETADEVFKTPEGMENLVNQMYYNFRWKYYGCTCKTDKARIKYRRAVNG